MNMYVALTAANAALFIVWFVVMRYMRIQWRMLLAMLPTPMLGFASSYGVYAFNAHFAPAWVAFAMAAAYELTYVGLASYTALNVAQRTEGQLISRDAAWISFIQNALAGLVYIQPSVLGYSKWSAAWPLVVNVPLAALHAAQVWIAYRTANFTLHGVEVKAVAVPVAQPTLEAPNEDNLIHRDAALWSQMNEQGMSFQAIADEVGKSKGWVHKQVRTYRGNVG